jgi:transcriptional regulator with XRE-family HTH domain
VAVKQLWRFSHIVPAAGIAGGRAVYQTVAILPDGTLLDLLGRTDKEGEYIKGAEVPDPLSATYVGHGSIVDDDFATFLRYHGHGSHLSPEPPPPGEPCPVDGSRGCPLLDQAKAHVGDLIQQGHRASLMGLAMVSGYLSDDGRATEQRQWHEISTCEARGLDWRAGAQVWLDGQRQWPYYTVWPEPPFPSAGVPHVEPPEPQPSVATPGAVRAWVAAAVEAGTIVMADRLPPVELRRTIREHAHLTQAELAEKIGVGKSTLQNYENGLRDPDPDVSERYAALLHELHELDEHAPATAEALGIDLDPEVVAQQTDDWREAQGLESAQRPAVVVEMMAEDMPGEIAQPNGSSPHEPAQAVEEPV